MRLAPALLVALIVAAIIATVIIATPFARLALPCILTGCGGIATGMRRFATTWTAVLPCFARRAFSARRPRADPSRTHNGRRDRPSG